MYLRIAAAIRSSFGTTLNAHLRRSSIGFTIAVAAASEMIGVLDSDATSSIVMVTGVKDDPIRMSTPILQNEAPGILGPLGRVRFIVERDVDDFLAANFLRQRRNRMHLRLAEGRARTGGRNDNPDLDVRTRVRGPKNYACKDPKSASSQLHF